MNKELRTRHRKSVLLLRLLLAVLVLIVLVALYRGLNEYGLITIIVDGETLRQKIHVLGVWGSLFIALPHIAYQRLVVQRQRLVHRRGRGYRRIDG